MNSILSPPNSLLSCSNPNLFTSLLPKAAPPASSLPLSPASPAHPVLWSTVCHLLCRCQNEPCLCQTGYHQELYCLFRSCRRPNGNRRSSKIRRRAWRWYHRHCRSSCRISACRHCLYRRGQFRDPKCFRSPLSFQDHDRNIIRQKPSLLLWILSLPSPLLPAASPTLPGPAAPPLSIP